MIFGALQATKSEQNSGTGLSRINGKRVRGAFQREGDVKLLAVAFKRESECGVRPDSSPRNLASETTACETVGEES